jgi:pyridoxal phosphate enzyme (YggS family)
MSGLADRLHRVDAAIADAARSAGRDPSDITRIVVTKFHPVSLIRELFELGVRDFGENRHQEAAAKAAELTDLDLAWHFVGQLQSKKARQALQYARVVHSVDRESLVAALSGDHPPVDCFVQLNLTDDPNRGGVQSQGVERLAELVVGGPGLNLLGVMAVAPLGEDPRRAFARVREISERVRRIEPAADRISAGMSGDFCEAVESGATHLRIGTAITGNRPAPA